MSVLERLETGWLPETPVGDTLLRRYLFNQADAQDVLAGAVGGRSRRTDDVALSDLGAPIDFGNLAILLRPLTGVDDTVLDQIDAFFVGAHDSSVLSAWPTPDLAARGWQLVGHPTFVARAPAELAASEPPGVSIRVARTAAELAEAERVVIEGYPMPNAAGLPANSMLGPAIVDRVTVRVGFLDGVAVSAATCHVGHGVLNLSLAATLPAARRRGVWRELVAARVSDAPDLPAAAITSDDSRPGFERLGFLPICRMTLWLRPGG